MPEISFFCRQRLEGIFVREEDEQMNKEIRLKTGRGLVIGDAEFIAKLEKKLDRSLKCLKWGRPKKDARND